MVVAGIDTSCYRTSAALVENGKVLRDERRLLEVDKGDRGLRQSEGLFQHVQNIGEVVEAVFKDFNGSLDAVCVSSRPRDVEGSYMPVFTAGLAVARAIAASHGVVLIETSHQQGHIRAALSSCDMPKGDFLAIHLSGGTTEIMRVTKGLNTCLIGKTSDLHAGQLVDRIGVRLGLPFPSGAYLEKLALDGVSKSAAPTSINRFDISLSGAEARLMNMIDGGNRPEDVACELYSFLERTLAKWIERVVNETGIYNILIAGGVAASGILRISLAQRLKKRGCKARLFWGSAEMSGDNAVGVALIGEDTLMKEE